MHQEQTQVVFSIVLVEKDGRVSIHADYLGPEGYTWELGMYIIQNLRRIADHNPRIFVNPIFKVSKTQ